LQAIFLNPAKIRHNTQKSAPKPAACVNNAQFFFQNHARRFQKSQRTVNTAKNGVN